MIHFGFGTYCSPSWLLPQTLAHMTHTFHHAITAKSFIKKIKLTSRQRSTHISSRQCPSSSLNREIPSSSKIKNNLKRKTFLDFLLWHTFHLSICHCSVELTSKNTQIHFTTNTLIKPKFMKKVVSSCVLLASAAVWRCSSRPTTWESWMRRGSWTEAPPDLYPGVRWAGVLLCPVRRPPCASVKVHIVGGGF